MDYGYNSVFIVLIFTICVFPPQRQAERALRQHHRLPGRHQDEPGQGPGQVKDSKKSWLAWRWQCTSFLYLIFNLKEKGQ